MDSYVLRRMLVSRSLWFVCSDCRMICRWSWLFSCVSRALAFRSGLICAPSSDFCCCIRTSIDASSWFFFVEAGAQGRRGGGGRSTREDGHGKRAPRREEEGGVVRVSARLR